MEEKLEYTPGPVVRKTGQLYDNPEKEVEKIKFTIDGREVTAVKGMSVLEAARLAGIEIPSLCYLRHINETGSCRVCLKQDKRRRPAAFSSPLLPPPPGKPGRRRFH